VSVLSVQFGSGLCLYNKYRRFFPALPLKRNSLLSQFGRVSDYRAVIYAAAKMLLLYHWMLRVYFFLYICGYVASLFFTKNIGTEDMFRFENVLENAGFASEAVS
jgi:hypothetical protein